EVSVYNRALSASGGASCCNTGSAGKCPSVSLSGCVPPASSLVNWWKGEGNANDEIGASNGTLGGNATFAPGLVGQAFRVDGDGDSVLVGNPSSLQLQTLTIEAWVKRSNATKATSDVSGVGVIFGYGSEIGRASCRERG